MIANKEVLQMGEDFVGWSEYQCPIPDRRDSKRQLRMRWQGTFDSGCVWVVRHASPSWGTFQGSMIGKLLTVNPQLTVSSRPKSEPNKDLRWDIPAAIRWKS